MSSMEKWSLTFGDVNLSLLYDLLREQFCNPEDPWYRDTLKWWNECVLQARGTLTINRSQTTVAMCSPNLQVSRDHRTEEKWRDSQRESKRNRSGKQEWLRVCPKLSATLGFDFFLLGVVVKNTLYTMELGAAFVRASCFFKHFFCGQLVESS